MPRGWTEATRDKAREKVRERQARYDGEVWPIVSRFLTAGLKPSQVAKAMDAIGTPSPGASLGHGHGWTTAAVQSIRRRNEKGD